MAVQYKDCHSTQLVWWIIMYREDETLIPWTIAKVNLKQRHEYELGVRSDAEYSPNMQCTHIYHMALNEYCCFRENQWINSTSHPGSEIRHSTLVPVTNTTEYYVTSNNATKLLATALLWQSMSVLPDWFQACVSCTRYRALRVAAKVRTARRPVQEKSQNRAVRGTAPRPALWTWTCW